MGDGGAYPIHQGDRRSRKQGRSPCGSQKWTGGYDFVTIYHQEHRCVIKHKMAIVNHKMITSRKASDIFAHVVVLLYAIHSIELCLDSRTIIYMSSMAEV